MKRREAPSHGRARQGSSELVIMKLEEAITYAIMSDGHGKTTDQIAAAINRNAWHVRKDGKPVTSAQVYACICRYPSIFTKEAGRICVML